MEKLIRFAFLSLFFIVFAVLLFCILPTLSWMFGYGFMPLIDSPQYRFTASLVIIFVLGCVFYSCFDGDFYDKER